MGDIEFLEQLLIGRRLFERVQLHPMDVLQEGVPQHRVVRGLADNGWNRREPGLLASAPTTLTHDDLILVHPRLQPTHHDGLHQAEFLDGVHQLGERLFLEDVARLLGIRFDLLRRNLAIGRTAIRQLLIAGVGDPVQEGRSRLRSDRIDADDDIGCGATESGCGTESRCGGRPRRNQRGKSAA